MRKHFVYKLISFQKSQMKTLRGIAKSQAVDYVRAYHPLNYCGKKLSTLGNNSSFYLHPNDKGVIIKSIDLREVDAYHGACVELEAAIVAGNLGGSPKIHKVIECHQGQCLVIMEKVNGVTLEDKVSSEKSLGFEERLRLCYNIAEKFNWLHKGGIVHNDVKTENIMISKKDNESIIIDFGCSKISGRDRDRVGDESLLDNLLFNLLMGGKTATVDEVVEEMLTWPVQPTVFFKDVLELMTPKSSEQKNISEWLSHKYESMLKTLEDLQMSVEIKG